MKKILLIEDNDDVRENTQEILELSGYKVVTAVNGKEGVALAQTEFPDLIICDIMMPELDGFGVLHLLSNTQETASIPFIFLTAKAEKSDLRKGMLLGADDYLTKPFDDVELLQAVEVRLHKSELLKTQFSRNAEGLSAFLGEVRHFQELRHLAENRRTHTYKKKESIYNENTYPGGVYFLESGRAKARRINDLGKEYITELYKVGDFFGYADLIKGNTYQDSVVALEDATVSFIPKHDFFKLLESDRNLSGKFIRMLSNEVKDREESLLKLAYNSVRKRVAEALVYLYEMYGKEGKDPFSVSMSREDIAGIVGTATETVIRTLSDFKDENLISLKGSNITVLELERLRRMKN
ncbi:hypothetical protein GCM10023091_25980 [Ravibacter arvi]|uniref:Transcriptional regulator n=1 Tax=Ravibacter arvi TaxID=2051041 RepID=A0ABP8M2R6_9BACT